MSSISKSNFDFLNKLARNNNRDWFMENKGEYEMAHANTISFADRLLSLLSEHDHIETISGKKSLHRIYRDIRFSKDKTPYKSHWGGGFKRATHLLRGGYYFHIEPGNSVIVGGFWGPNADDIKRIRQEISANDQEFRDIINDSKFIKSFKQLEGEKLKSAPRGFDKQDPAIDLLRFKQYLLIKRFTDKEVLSDGFANAVDETFRQMRPFFNYMSEVLTTNVDGESIY